MPYKLSILLSSLVLAAIFAVIGWNLYGQIGKHFELEISYSSARLHNVYIAQNETLARRAQTLAFSIAANTE
ncbi:MAG: hypothetical protein LBV29_07625, partial [Azoarcus sp.]|nr:hypothetical protein [Azoarcus sp.]